ncbi:MAG: YjbQ family protein [Candidatus Sericytochromatia bacterium]|nr:YjbQ family protein [Candidatus Sericytochromatia bacterium]
MGLRSFELRSSGTPEPLLLTSQLERLVQSCQYSAGLMQVYVPGSGAALLSVDCPEGDLSPLQQTIADALRLSENPHLLSALLGTRLALPFQRQKLLRATWQEIALVEWMPMARWHQIQVLLTEARP